MHVFLTEVYEQFAPGSSSEVLITSADSRIRVVDGFDLAHKFKGMEPTLVVYQLNFIKKIL